MIPPILSNRLVFVSGLLGLAISSFLFYEYTFSSFVVCLVGSGCDIVRKSPYSVFFGISLPIWGIAFYLAVMAVSVLRSQKLFSKALFNLQLLIAAGGVVFGVYLTYLEIFVIKAVCFWCVLSFIISLVVLLSVVLVRKD